MSQKFTATENQDYQSALHTQNTPQRRKRPSPSLLHHLRIAMLAVGGAILLSGLLLLVLPMLHVSDIQVIGRETVLVSTDPAPYTAVIKRGNSLF